MSLPRCPWILLTSWASTAQLLRSSVPSKFECVQGPLFGVWKGGSSHRFGKCSAGDKTGNPLATKVINAINNTDEADGCPWAEHANSPPSTSHDDIVFEGWETILQSAPEISRSSLLNDLDSRGKKLVHIRKNSTMNDCYNSNQQASSALSFTILALSRHGPSAAMGYHIYAIL